MSQDAFSHCFCTYLDCSEVTVLTNILQKDGIKYLFVINDKRTYSQRLKDYKAILDKTIPQTVTITLNHRANRKIYLYDMLAKKKLTYSRENDVYKFDVELNELGGKIIAICDKEFAAIEIAAPSKIKETGVPCRIDIRITDSQGNLMPGVWPMSITITDPEGNISEFSDYFAAESGTLSIDFVAAVNDTKGKWKIEAEELMTGKRKEAHFEVF